MMGCDTLLTVGSNFPYTQFMPDLGQARAVQIDRSGKWIGMRYPYEINLVGDAKTTLRALIPLLTRKADRGWREQVEADVTDWWQTAERRAMTGADPVNPMRIFHELSAAAARERDRRQRLRQRRELVRPAPEIPRRHARLAVRHPGHHGPRGAVRDRREMGAPRPAGDRPGRRRRDADERPGRADHHRAVLVAVGRPAADRRGPAQQRPQPGHLGDAGHGRCPEVRRVADPARRRLRRLRPQPRPDRHPDRRPRRARPGLGGRAGRGPAHRAGRDLRPGRAADPAARHLRAGQVRRRGGAARRRGRLGLRQAGRETEGAAVPSRVRRTTES